MDTLTTTTTVDEVAALLDRDGFAIIENYLGADDVRAKKEDLYRILQSTPTGRNDFEGHQTQRIYALFAKTRVFDEQAIDPLLLGVLERVLGPNFTFSAPVGINIGPGETAQNLHTDDGIYPVRRPHQQFVLNTMWALDDFTEENGATQVVPGSHTWTEKAPDAESRIVRAVMPAGSVMFFLGSVWHGGGANHTDRPRLGVILHYCAGWLRPQEDHVLGVPKEIVRDLPPRLQELLGYGVYPPFVGNVDGRHPRKYLDDTRRVKDGVLEPDGNK
jgi:ectoine hydroxylase-related dioxygenase (phytanoyl-CoA dioxygenase family)